MTSDRNAFGAETTTDEVLEGISLEGKTALVTGGTSGLGAETARALAAHGADVIITARQPEKAAQVAEDIAAQTGRKVEVEALELGSMASARAFSERIVARGGGLDLVIANAGVMACPQMKTEDGFELQFGSNHLGHFLAVNRIVPALSAGARVVVLSSAAHHMSPVVFEDIGFESREYQPWAAYGQAKTANALYAAGLNRRLSGRGAEAFSVHPGVIMTGLARHLEEEDMARFQGMIDSGQMKLKTIPQGAATQVYAATAPELAGQGGSYLADCAVSPVDDSSEAHTAVRSYALDPDLADRLWSVSEELVGERFSF